MHSNFLQSFSVARWRHSKYRWNITKSRCIMNARYRAIVHKPRIMFICEDLFEQLMLYQVLRMLFHFMFPDIRINRFDLSSTRADARFAPSQWGMTLLCNDVSRWLSANLDSALNTIFRARTGLPPDHATRNDKHNYLIINNIITNRYGTLSNWDTDVLYNS